MTLRHLLVLLLLAGWALSFGLPSAPPQDLKPPSELALLMRNMATYMDTARARTVQGRDRPPYPEQFKKMMTATPTEGMVDHAVYDPFAEHFLSSLDRFYKAKKKDRVQQYNALVQACANCHMQVCPGPLVRIKKMYVTLPEPIPTKGK
jgi:hypothetical protein